MERKRFKRKCRVCGAVMELPRNLLNRRRTCSMECNRVWCRKKMTGNKFRVGYGPNSGSFKSGVEPWNKGLEGIHMSPGTEFRTGNVAANKAPVGTVRIRKFRRSSDERAFVKIAEPNVWRLRAHVIWEERFGPIPAGRIVHHHDRNTLNDSPSNLVLLSRAAHILEHRAENEARRLAGLRNRKR